MHQQTVVILMVSYFAFKNLHRKYLFLMTIKVHEKVSTFNLRLSKYFNFVF